ncbi:MAG: hypothetical protein ACREUZ_22975, partial [Burkholderiales bacterium]
MSLPIAVVAIARALLWAAIALAAMDRIALAAETERPSPLKSGIELASEDVRSMQADDFANPGMLWVTRGEASWNKPAGKANQSCADCHGQAAQRMRG